MSDGLNPELLYKIALSMIPGIGGITARRIISMTGSSSAVFSENPKALEKLPRADKILAEKSTRQRALEEAHEELDYIRSEKIRVYCFGEPDYPMRLAQCNDAPLLFYARGEAEFNTEKVIGIVGTRRPTSYGMETCRKLTGDLKKRGHDCLVVSGLAYGIDHCAHQSALIEGLQTVAVLGHGLRYIYPARHRNTAIKITGQGALVTDFPSRQKPEPNNFIKRNRIIAGLSDCVVVVESGIRGGALITADLAGSYNRDVFAYPGKSGDPMSAGCNGLIKSHRAALIESCRDLEYILGWEPSGNTDPAHPPPVRTGKDEKRIIEVLAGESEVSIDEICEQSGMHVKTISGILLNLEFRGLVICLPGNRYRLANAPGLF